MAYHRNMPTERQTDRPLRADAERNRLRILDAAHEVFGERGLHATLDEVAARAGVGVGTVYRRFADREALVNALFESRIEELIEIAERAERNPDPWEGLVYYLREGTEFLGRNRALRELLVSAPGGREWVDRVRDTVRPKVARVVAAAQEQGKLRRDFAMLDIPLIEMMLAEVMEFTAAVAPNVWRRLLGYVIDGLMVSRAEPTPVDADPIKPEDIPLAIERSGGSSPGRR
jgi:AcrR family transcriptional regulator